MKDCGSFLALMTRFAEFVLVSRKERHVTVGMEEFEDLLMKEGRMESLEDIRMLRILEAKREDLEIKAERHRAERALALLMPGILSEAAEGRRNYLVIKAFREDFRAGRFGEPDALIRGPKLVWDELVRRGMRPVLDDRYDFTYGRCFHVHIAW